MPQALSKQDRAMRAAYQDWAARYRSQYQWLAVEKFAKCARYARELHTTAMQLSKNYAQ